MDLEKVDLQMARSQGQDGFYNLAIGEPIFLQEASTLDVSKFSASKSHFQYPPAKGTGRLISILQELNPGKHIVVTNGAKQALLASIYACSKVMGCSTVKHSAPHWPSFLTLAEEVLGMGFDTKSTAQDIGCHIMTAPSNPCGLKEVNQLRILRQVIKCHVWDAVYASDIYGWHNQLEIKHFLKVDSVSKKYGFSGIRVGWIVTDDEELAREAEYYSEITTSGVSSLSQDFAAFALEQEAERGIDAIFNSWAAKKTLELNAESFNKYIAPFCTDIHGLPNKEGGMFAFFKIDNNLERSFDFALRECKVLSVSGRSCGYGFDMGRWYRFSMGNNVALTQKALQSLHETVMVNESVEKEL